MHMQKAPIKLSGSQTRKPSKVGRGVLERQVLSGMSVGWGVERENDLCSLCTIVKTVKEFQETSRANGTNVLSEES